MCDRRELEESIRAREKRKERKRDRDREDRGAQKCRVNMALE